MDDRAISVLENYECKVLRTWKGRGAILCETDQGLKILKEYFGPKEKAEIQNLFLTHIKDSGFTKAEQIVRNKEGDLLTLYCEKSFYILKDYFQGKECNVKDESECIAAIKRLAKLHEVSKLGEYSEIENIQPFSLAKEYDKHNRELKKVRNYIKQKGQKNDFEIYLMKYFDIFYEKALQVQNEILNSSWEDFEDTVKKQGFFCHGDYQYHNILFSEEEVSLINFEKYCLDSRIRDVYLFMRKVLEKNNWNEAFGQKLLEEYEKEYPLTKEERLQLSFRFQYPEKFWKIVNFYFNSGKAFISERNSDKLEKLLKSQELMKQFIVSIKI